LLNKNFSFVWLDSSNEIKKSYHLIVKNIVCNINENEQIKNHLNNKLNSSFLDNVYTKNRCFRMWNCSKFGENRPLKLINSKHFFNDTLVNIYPNEKVGLMCANIELEKQKQPNQSFFRNVVNVPFNAYLYNNFKQNKKNPSTFNRKNKNTSLPCPICISEKELCKSKHHKRTDVYIFKKNNNTYMGCYRSKKWHGDRYFLNLFTNKVEYVPISNKNKISPNIVSTITTYKNCNHKDVNKSIIDLLNQTVNFGKYNDKLFKDLFKDASCVNYIIVNFGESAQARLVCEKLINYFNNEYRPKAQTPKKSIKSKPTIQFKPTVKEMISYICTKTKTNYSLWENMSKKELEMHYGFMSRV
jgi:hypothetical protein